MIEHFTVKNYKALRDVTLNLTPIHVLIGPNDSGKTSILEALGAFCRSVDSPFQKAFRGSWSARELVWGGSPDNAVELGTKSAEWSYQLSVQFHPTDRAVVLEREIYDQEGETPYTYDRPKGVSSVSQAIASATTNDARLRSIAQRVHASLSGVHYYRWVPKFLAIPTALDLKRRWQLDVTGFGLALFLDDILGHNRDQFGELEKKFREFFPEIASIELVRQPAFHAPVDDAEQVPRFQQADGKGIRFRLAKGAQSIPASQASDGILIVLAYLAIIYSPNPPRVLLIEEPENGVHPRRLEDVIGILRDLIKGQSHTQVLLTTHSPYVVNLFKPEEVTVCRKLEDGSVGVRRLDESKLVRDQMDLFTLGEIWTSEGDEALAEPIDRDREQETSR